MARDRQFDEDEVLHAAADLFSAYGYQGTSLAMLLQATGLGKQSLYNTFGDKRSLYLKSVDCAVQRAAALAARMQQAPDGRTAVARFFDGVVAACASGEPAERSCIVSAGLLEGVEDPTIRHHLLDKWRLSHELLRQAVERGQKDGSIRHPGPSAVVADLLMALTSGLRVSAHGAPAPERLAAAAALGLTVLDQPAAPPSG